MARHVRRMGIFFFNPEVYPFMFGVFHLLAFLGVSSDTGDIGGLTIGARKMDLLRQKALPEINKNVAHENQTSWKIKISILRFWHISGLRLSGSV